MNSNNYLNDLDNLLDDLSYAKVNLPCHYSHLSSDSNCHHQTANRNQINQNSYSSPQKSRARTGSQQVNELIKNLEQNLHFPNEARNMTGKPIHLNHKYDNEYMNLMDLKPSPTRAQLTPSAHQHQYQHQHSIATPQSAASVNSSPKRVVINNNVQHVNHVHNHPTAASCATRELDDLMASLNDFKMKERSANTATNSVTDYAKVHGPSKVTMVTQPQHLDSIIGNLQSDMIRHGVDTTAKGHCHACHKPIVGQVVTALGKTWHPEHFTCVHCGSELGTKNFFERDSEPYCETDYHNLFSPRCAYCNASILDKCITALDKTWHPEHFFCAHCGKSFGDDGYHDKDGKPYCRNDYFELFAPKCGGCATSITDNYISALNTQWHPECFVCRDCRTPFNGGHFFDHEGQPYCEVHYHAHRGSLCAGCHKPITGRCITAMYRKFHPEHFVCSFCLKQLNKGTFKEQNDKPYCHNCFEKLFA